MASRRSILLNYLLVSLVFSQKVLCYDDTCPLTVDYYRHECPQVFSIVRSVIQKAMFIQPRNAASVLRLFFHDCIVNGCDASILLDDTPMMKGEKAAFPNVNSVRGYEIIDHIKEEVERACPGTVSCADILAIAARDSVTLSGGPYWEVPLGRLDSLSASIDAANEQMPQPTFDLPQLAASFDNVGLNYKDLVALVGAHSIGFARCANIAPRLYNVTPDGIRPDVLSKLRARCPQGGNQNTLQQLDFLSPAIFDNAYFSSLIHHAAVLHSDQTLYTQGDESGVRSLVERFSRDREAFFQAFVQGMLKMGNLRPPFYAPPGEVRTSCRYVNPS